MGIVSFCPQGHRIKVKDSLAGKKGICPTCGARFRIAQISAPPPAVAAPAATSLPVATLVSLDAAEAARLPRALLLDQPVVAPAAAAPLRSVPVAAAPVADQAAEAAEAAVETVEFEDDTAALHPVIAERPDLAWCHAVPGGSASEPLGAEAMQAWLESGQAGAETLVWRADWPEWRPLDAVFPDRAGR